MTTEELSRKFFTLLLILVTFLVLGSFVVSLDIGHFIYLIVLYVYVYLIHEEMKKAKDD